MRHPTVRPLVAAATAFAVAVGLSLTGVAPARAAGGLTAAFAQTSDWGSGYQAEFTITNRGSEAVDGWTVEFDLPSGSSVGAYWNALETKSGDHYTFTERSYNATIAPGKSVTFGFVADGDGTPTGCALNDGPCTGSGDTSPPSAPSGLTVTGHTSTSISLSWTAAADDTGVTTYDVVSDGAVKATATGTSVTVTGLRSSTTYTFAVRAEDAAGNVSPLSGEVTATTDAGSEPPGGAVPAVVPYVDMGSWPTPTLTDMASAGNLDGFTLGFVTGAACKASWFAAYDPRDGLAKDQIEAIRDAGGDVVVSFGGASGIELALACTDVNKLEAEYAAVVDTYRLDRIDLDIEGAAVADDASIRRRSQALAALQESHPGLEISFTLPVLPEGLTADGLNVVRSARDAGVDVELVNVMAMDYYRDGTDMGDAAVQAARSLFGQLTTLYPNKPDDALWAMVGVTPMLGKNDDGSTYDQADARQLVAFAEQHHLGELSFWEETRDRNACTGALYECTNIPQQPYEFSKIFAGYTG